MNNWIKLGLLLLSVLPVAACQEKTEAAEETPRPVLSVVAEETPAGSLRLTGTVEPKTRTELGFRVLGRILARNVDTGDLVKKDEVVATIDPLALELAVKSAQFDLSNAEAQLANAVVTEKRQRSLQQSRAGTDAALEDAEQKRRSADASVARAQANLQKAKEQLGYAQLRAEFDGVVTATSAEIGQVVSAGQTVVTIARPEERDAVVDVPQQAAQQLRIGAPFEVSLQLDPSIRAKGVVREIAPEAETATRTRRTKIGLIDPPAAFRLGSVVTVAASVAAEPQILLPSSAVLSGDRGTGVWVIDAKAGTVAFRPIGFEGKLADGGAVKVTQGIRPGERIVVAGVHKLKDGQPIRIDQEARP